jgi:RNA polymerase sigma-70 factor (ECF subfamily)
MTDDRPLVESAIRGELYAFNQLMKSWHKRIFNFAYRYLNDYDEASEVTQQTFIKAYQAIGTLKDPGRFRAWLYIIASNGCRAHTRRAGRYATESLHAGDRGSSAWGQLPGGENPEKQLQCRDWERLLKRALAQIPEEQRLVIIMKEYEGSCSTRLPRCCRSREHGEIADVLRAQSPAESIDEVEYYERSHSV